ncbi:glycosyltransferase family 2 protein [Staphylococcus saprophyticus]|uniref:Putative glycosyltransferase TagX n=2 Tax=Staphylococcus TaxID=1279 RepID=B2DCM2_STASA|nr:MULTISPECIES: glycosyltransferase family 2 protein [Staphylococcus]MCG2103226.1 glycosyltransferase family 2 protein [Staphylococcus epidermidis]MCD9063434.1 glycosyltransferase family 2 protein [Staphylococcus saprophyticus]MDK9866998.1 glycosyltransferase family 2 protein [Staphylococcus equorum]MDW3915297.1 glycosyltransferase family 2 protein [Staphylococcus saprophyticus]MDW4010513.1 glycosyltransferase family 2 protein [Staphylococcus saprophyticus]
MISVVIPYFKSARTIDRAIHSVLHQTHPVYEIIIVNDYSNTTEDAQKLQELEDNLNNVRILNLRENKGPSYARNKGMDEAEGDYIAFLDSDDTWTLNKIEVQSAIMEETKAFLSAHLSSQFGKKEVHKKSYKKISPKINLLSNRLPTRSIMMLNTKKYRFNIEKRYAEDFLLWSQILLDGKKVVMIEETLAHSYKEDYGESGLTQNIFKMHKGIIDVYNRLYKQRKIGKFEYIGLLLFEQLKQNYRLIRVFIRR